ncbi:hormogonium polysaccharide secretion pseudopilin HpsC [Microcoleus sp. herbarium19]
MKSLLRLLLKNQHPQNRYPQAQTEKGMTLIELLIGTVMAFLIITPMLAFVVDMLNTDRREQVKTNTEQDIQAAVDFIAQDLSQAIHIYDNNTTTGIPALIEGQFIPTGADRTPILVFWKRQIIRSAIPADNTVTPQPSDCPTDPQPGQPRVCDDTYVLSLVAYYQITDNLPIWCQPSGLPCPTRIARYQIQDGLENKKSLTTGQLYTQFRAGQTRHRAYNAGNPATNAPAFDITRPEQNVTRGGANFDEPPEVLVNYIDHTPKPLSGGNECANALGNPAVTSAGGGSTPIGEGTLKITDPDTNSFYACVDTSRNIARVTIRGNSLRRLQNSNVPSSPENSAFFPTASVQVQGLGARGR